MNVEIYLNDLKPEMQKEVLDLLGIVDAKEGNYDIFPLFIIERPE